MSRVQKYVTPHQLRRLKDELEALRFATLLLCAVMRSETFAHECAPLPTDAEGRHEWARQCLLPLGPSSTALRKALSLLDWSRSFRNWDNPRWAKRELRRMRREAVIIVVN